MTNEQNLDFKSELFTRNMVKTNVKFLSSMTGLDIDSKVILDEVPNLTEIYLGLSYDFILEDCSRLKIMDYIGDGTNENVLKYIRIIDDINDCSDLEKIFKTYKLLTNEFLKNIENGKEIQAYNLVFMITNMKTAFTLDSYFIPEDFGDLKYLTDLYLRENVGEEQLRRYIFESCIYPRDVCFSIWKTEDILNGDLLWN